MAGKRIDLASLNRGRLRHPTYGRRPWVDQRVGSGFWTRATDRAGKAAAEELLEAMREAARFIAKRAGGS